MSDGRKDMQDGMRAFDAADVGRELGAADSARVFETPDIDHAFETPGADDGGQAASIGLDDHRLWPTDTGVLSYDARRALLQLVRGPLISSDANRELWVALLNNQDALRSRLSDMLLELIVDTDEEIAFVRNAATDENGLVKAVRSQPLTALDTIMVLTLRKELMIGTHERIFVGKDELFDQLEHFRPIDKMDAAAFRKRLDTSWSRLKDAGLLRASDTEDRCEISPVLRLVFGADEVGALAAEYDRLLDVSDGDEDES